MSCVFSALLFILSGQSGPGEILHPPFHPGHPFYWVLPGGSWSTRIRFLFSLTVHIIYQ